jgi:multicomponent Na+:H+ antiporter subunit E
MSLLLLTITLALTWALITGSFTALNLLFGALIGFVALYLLRDYVAKPRVLRQIGRTLSLAVLFLRELLVSAFRVAVVVVTPDLRSVLRPAIIAFPLKVKTDAEITLLANLITLTPGTLSVDVAEDRSVLYVHALMLGTREALIAEIAAGFEAKVHEVFA